jgi:hypothetical protein
MANDNIFQQYLTPPKSVMDYTAEMDQADTRRNALQMSALGVQEGQMKMANAADIGSQRNALRAAVTAGQIDLSNPDHVSRALSIAPDVAPGLLKTVQDGATARATAAKATADTAGITQKTAASEYDLRVKKSDQAVKDIAGFNSPQEALASLQAHVAAGDVDPAKAQMIQQGMPQDPAKFSDWKVGMIRNIMSAKEQMQYSTPDANTVATNARVATEGAANRSNQVKVAQMVSDRQDASDSPNASFTPGAIDNAAKRYNVDGTLPQMGMGKAGSAGRTTILNRAAELAAGVDGTDQRVAQLGAKGEASAKAASLRAYSAGGKEGQALQAANTGLNHLDTVEQLAMAQKNGNTQLFNTIANRFAKETGLAAPTSLAAAITMVAPEVSKAVIGAAGGQEERATFAKNFNGNGSPQQTLQGIGVIKELMGGRLTEAQRTYERTVGKKDFRETMLSPAAQRVLDKAHGVDSAGAKPSLSDIFGK